MKGSVIARNDSDEAIYVKYKKISMELKRYKLGEIGEIRMCKRVLKEETNSVGGVPFFKIGTFGGQADVFITKEKFEEYKNAYSYPKKGDVLISAAGTIGRTVVFDGKDAYFQDSNIVWIENDESKVLNEYLFYCYKNIRWTTSVGSTILRLYNDDIRNTDIIVPPLSEQKKIASVLSALDDKIALNKKMNQKLEAMAKRLYDYWFVQYDFPDKNGHPYKTTGGPMTYNPSLKREIPVGWEVKQICDIAKIFNGSTPSTTEEGNYGGEIVWITPKDLSDQNCKFVYQGARNITQAGYDSCSTTMVPKGTVVMSSRAPIGLLSIAQCDLCTNQGFKNMVPNDMTDSKYLYYTIQQHIPQIQNLGTGTTFKEVSKDELGRFAILYPPKKLITTFEEKMAPIFDVQFNKVKEISRLTALRDKLLPLLMNGQVIVD